MSNKIRFNFIKIVGQKRSEASNRYVYVAYIPLKCLKKNRFFVLWSFKKLYKGCFFSKGHRKRTYFFFHGFQWDITRDGASLMAQTVKNPPAIWEAWVQSLGWQDPMEELMTTHSSILAWRISMNRGAWRATVHGVTKSQTWLRTKHSTAQGTSQRECVELQSLWSQWPSGIFTATVVPHQA